MSGVNVELPVPRPHVALLEPYVPGEQPSGPGYIKLNTNEFPYPAPDEVKRAVAAEAADSVRVYPNPTSAPLRAALAAKHGVLPTQVFVGNGSDEILRLLAHAFVGAGRTLAIVRPSYTLYEALAAQFESKVVVHSLVDDERLPASLFGDPWDACFLPVPNPPLGTVFTDEELRRLAAHGGLLALDEAYIEFTEPRPHHIEWLEELPNLVLTRTFSKSHGLAGMRVGYALARPETIDWLDRLRDSYNVNRVSQAAALAALRADGYYESRCAEIRQSRAWLTDELRRRGFQVHESQGNFVFARRRRAEELYTALKERKILVRHFKHGGLENGLRITIGTPPELRALIDALDDLLR